MPASQPAREGVERLISALQEISLASTVDDVADAVVKTARDLIHADGANFILRDGDLCYHVAENAIAPLWKGQRFSMNVCLSGYVMRHKHQVVVPDVYEDERIPVDLYRTTFIKSLVMTPIRQRDPIGAIGTFWADGHEIREEECKLLQALADSTSVAMQNVTLYAQLEKQITELRVASKAKDEFLMTLSHELRSPLSAILGWAEVLAGDAKDPKLVAKGTASILRNAKAQLRLVDDLLDTARVISGHFKMARRAVDVQEPLLEAIELVRLRADDSSPRIRTDGMDNHVTVEGDEARIRQIFVNLLENAVKFTPGNGTIDVSLERTGPNVRVAIKDSGAGISPDALPYIFDQFRQADSSVARKYGGLGLGLTIARKLANLLSGSITAESEGPGKGSTFVFQLPLMSIEHEHFEKSDGDRHRSHLLDAARILIVDDSEDARCLLDIIFAEEGAETRCAESAKDAERTLHEFRPNLLVCDINMPGEDGSTFIRRIRHGDCNVTVDVPAIALTAYADDFHKDRALAAGFNEYITKPYRYEDLIAAASALLARPAESREPNRSW